MDFKQYDLNLSDIKELISAFLPINQLYLNTSMIAV